MSEIDSLTTNQEYYCLHGIYFINILWNDILTLYRVYYQSPKDHHYHHQQLLYHHHLERIDDDNNKEVDNKQYDNLYSYYKLRYQYYKSLTTV